MSVLEQISTQLASQSVAHSAHPEAATHAPKRLRGPGYEWTFPKLSIAPENGVRRITSSKVHLTEADEKILDAAYQQSQTPPKFASRLMRHLFEFSQLTDQKVTMSGAGNTRRLDRHTIEFIRKQIEKRFDRKPKTWSKCTRIMANVLSRLKRGRREGLW